MTFTRRTAFLCSFLLTAAISSRAQEASSTEEANTSSTQASSTQAAAPAGTEKIPSRWHLYGGLGVGTIGGDYGDFTEDPIQLDLRIAKATESGKWRFGAGLHFGSMAMKPPHKHEDDEWGHLET